MAVGVDRRAPQERTRVVRPPVAPGRMVTLCRLSPDGRRLAWVVDDGTAVHLEVGLPDGAATRVLTVGEGNVTQLHWSPDGARLAYVVAGRVPAGIDHHVGWADAAADGERGRVPGAAFAWTPKGKMLVVVDVERGAVLGLDPRRGTAKPLGRVQDDGHPVFAARVAAAPSGLHVAVSSRRSVDQLCEVSVLSRTRTDVEQRVVTQVPGADVHLIPFWSPKGRTLGLRIVHPPLRRSAVIAVPHLAGDGVVLHGHDAVDAAEPAAWSPSAKRLAFFVADGAVQRLVVVDAKSLVLRAVDDVAVVGTPRFLDESTLVVDGGDEALVATVPAQS
jgi:dipeptidyl aminopeptidase/acylaminoacyl peptidase